MKPNVNILEEEQWISKVKNRRLKDNNLLIKLENGITVEFRRFATVGKKDLLEYTSGDYWVHLKNNKGKVRITPAWQWKETLPDIKELDITIKEIESEDELNGYMNLTKFHYRGNGGMGRRVPLVAKVNDLELPNIVGFIELSSSFLVNTARSRILNSVFSDPENKIAWSKWDFQTAKTYGNCIARISRCVVYPELRGLGLSSLLTKAVVKYAKERWHIGGLRPIFIEITAEMLRYWPFVSTCGFFYVGETEGNKDRAVKDMKYLIEKALKSTQFPQGGGGILSLQRSNATLLQTLMKKNNLNLNQIVKLLKHSPEKLSDEDWVALHKVYRRPKPTYMIGLTESANNFLKRRHRIAGTPFSERKRQWTGEIVSLMSIQNMNIEICAKPTSSYRARRVQEAFGIVSSEFTSTLIKNLDFQLSTGEIILVCGPSGTGKSLFLHGIKALVAKGSSKGQLPKGVTVNCSNKSQRLNLVWSRKIPSNKSPIELFNDLTIEEAIQILSFSGLAEPQLFVQSLKTLSLGQYYRLTIAKSLSEKPDVVMIDEFCEPLDKFTTIAVCRKLRRAAWELGIGIIACTAYPSKVAPFLSPHKTLLLSSDGNAKWK